MVRNLKYWFSIEAEISKKYISYFCCSESDPRCPVDNQSLTKSELFPDNYAKREILNLTVKCPNYKKGCDQVVTLSDIQVNLLISP